MKTRGDLQLDLPEGPMKTMFRTQRPTAALLLSAAALLAGGCGDVSSRASGADTAGGARTADGQPGSVSTPSTDAPRSVDARRQAVRFADCMRRHGVDEFPDPDVSGSLTADAVANQGQVDTSGPGWETALRSCKNLQPAGFTGHQRRAEQQASALDFAQCIRDNGVPDFPDPGPGDPLIDTNRIPSAAGKGGLELPGLNAAMDTCGDRYADRLGLKRP